MVDTDSQLARRLARGDDAAFAELYDACSERLLRYLAVRLASVDKAADVLQTAMLRAVKSRRRFAKVESPEAYLFQIARNEAARLAKRAAQRSEQSLTAEQMLELMDEAPDSREDVETIVAALARLDEEDRELVQLKIYAGLTFREVAAVTGQPLATAATRYRRALDSLRPWLVKQYQE
jgi:RNA polymerase sigma-70 factor (ECF subfamily)